jgi:hypothetical protein
MIKKNLRFIFTCFVFLSFNSFADNIVSMKLGKGIEYTLEANEPLLISNPYLWTIKAVCTVMNKDDDNFLAFKVTRKQGKLNGVELLTGDSMTLRLHSNEKMNITAVSGAEVELLNIGNRPIITECVYNF